MKGQSEEQSQIEFVNWLHRNYPDQWSKFHHSPNGGKRDPRTAGKMKLMGTKPGFPDLVLYEKRGDYTGLVIEMKKEGGRVSDYQKAWLAILEDQGCLVAVAYSLDEAKEIFEDYVNG